MNCLGCERTDTATLLDGSTVCTTCPAWRQECEAREWLARIRAKKPRTWAEGKALLDRLTEEIAKRRGDAAAEQLKDAILAQRRS